MGQTEEKMNEALNSIAHLETLNVLTKDEFQKDQFDSEEAHNNFLSKNEKHQLLEIHPLLKSLGLAKLLHP